MSKRSGRRRREEESSSEREREKEGKRSAYASLYNEVRRNSLYKEKESEKRAGDAEQQQIQRL